MPGDKFGEELNNELFTQWVQTLDTQAKLFSPKEIALFERFGLGNDIHCLLDLGCGAGAYTQTLRKRYPAMKAFCTDINAQLLAEFKKRLENDPDPSIEIHQWNTLEEPSPVPLKSCNAAVLRLMLTFFNNPCDVLKMLKEKLSPGTLLFIVEEEDRLAFIEPGLPAFDKILKIWRAARRELDIPSLGRQMPNIIKQAGFEVIHSELVAHSSYDVGPANLLKYYITTLRLTYHYIPNYASLQEIEEIEQSIKNHVAEFGKGCFFIYPQILTIARVPDAP